MVALDCEEAPHLLLLLLHPHLPLLQNVPRYCQLLLQAVVVDVQDCGILRCVKGLSIRFHGDQVSVIFLLILLVLGPQIRLKHQITM